MIARIYGNEEANEGDFELNSLRPLKSDPSYLEGVGRVTPEINKLFRSNLHVLRKTRFFFYFGQERPSRFR